MCTCFGFKAEPMMGLGCVYCVYVFALGLAGFGLGLVNVCFGFQAEPVMGLWCVCVCFGFGQVWVGFGVFVLGSELNL